MSKYLLGGTAAKDVKEESDAEVDDLAPEDADPEVTALKDSLKTAILSKLSCFDGTIQAKVNDILTEVSNKAADLNKTKDSLDDLINELTELRDEIGDAIDKFEDGVSSIKEGLNALNEFLEVKE